MLRALLAAVLATAAIIATAATGNAQTAQPTSGTLLAQGLQGSILGGTIGPDGALYVPQGAVGSISRIDPVTGAITALASGLPAADFGGITDVAFVGNTAYALVTLVAPDHIVGIYRIDDATHSTVIADIGQFSVAHPPPYPIDIPTGLQYQLQPVDGGFLVSDGHHNRILKVTLAGEITELKVFDNVVPTGLAVSANTVYVSEVGPVPYLASSGKVVSFDSANPATVTELGGGYSVMDDVELGPGGKLYALSQGDSPGVGVNPGEPARPNSGKLLRLNGDGTISVLVDRLDLPTSLQFIGNTAFIVTLNGTVWKVDNVPQLAPITPAPTPTAVPPTTAPPTATATAAPLPPNTGTGSAAGGTGEDGPWLALGVVILFALASGSTVAVARRSTRSGRDKS